VTNLVSHPDNVKIGQTWEDNDPRMKGRLLHVVWDIGGMYIGMTDSSGRTRTYLRRRMRANSRGFKLVEEAS
jgi:hypothetical protein